MQSAFMNALLKRRSTYDITDTIPLSDEELIHLLGTIVQNTPTAFNMQSSRAVLLLGDAHHKLWQIVLDVLRPHVPEESFYKTAGKISGFDAGHGTILFFDDTAVTGKFAAAHATFRDLFPDWALQQNGMLQFAIWSALAEQGIGANLQHYNPLIDNQVAACFGLPGTWQLLAQMPFGIVASPPAPKEFEPLETRFKIFGET